MKMLNSQIAEKFAEIADLLEIANANQFRVRAYRNAALLIENLPRELADLIAENKPLTDLPGIGKDLAQKIEKLVKTGELPLLDQLHKKTPPALTEMLKIPGLGPHRVKQLYDKLHIKNLDDLKKAIAANKVQKLKRFGAKTQTKIGTALDQFTKREKRTKFIDAERIAKQLIAYLKKFPGIDEVIIAGSYRRCRETVGDLDILVSAKDSIPIIKYFIVYDDFAKIIAEGSTKATVRLRSGLQVDLRVVKQESFGAALQYFTGSKAHSVELRKIAVRKKLKLNEYGVFKGNKYIAGKTEHEVYNALDLSYIEPELRENRGEIEAAKNGTLPKLINLIDIRGDLHVHTKATDGKNSIEELALAAKKLGYSYLAITDHSKHLTVAKGLDEKKLRQQINYINKLNADLKNFRILKSIEVDILEDGSLDLSNEILQELDFTVCSIHYKFNLSRPKQTERVLRAMDNPYFNILAHPTGRLINERPPYDIDLEKIMHAAKERGCVLELNSQPERLDLNDVHCKLAKEIGVKIAISTDTHHVDTLSYMAYGIAQARRGWLEAGDVVNTLPLPRLLKLLHRR
jgi:DNA polymerase (family X)